LRCSTTTLHRKQIPSTSSRPLSRRMSTHARRALRTQQTGMRKIHGVVLRATIVRRKSVDQLLSIPGVSHGGTLGIENKPRAYAVIRHRAIVKPVRILTGRHAQRRSCVVSTAALPSEETRFGQESTTYTPEDLGQLQVLTASRGSPLPGWAPSCSRDTMPSRRPRSLLEFWNPAAARQGARPIHPPCRDSGGSSVQPRNWRSEVAQLVALVPVDGPAQPTSPVNQRYFVSAS
jgi:hypothetical protein